MRIVISALIIGLLAFASFNGVKIHQQAKQLNAYKYDFAEINKINYGLFNIGLWKEKIFTVIERKAGDFEFDAKSMASFQTQIESYLYNLHDEYIESGKLVEMFLDKDNQDNKMVAMFMNMFKGNIEKQVQNLSFKDKIPGIAAQMMKEFENKIPELKKQITKQVGNMLVEESNTVLVDKRDVIYEKYMTTDLAETSQVISESVASLDASMNKLINVTLAVLLGALVLIILSTKFLQFKYAMVLMTLLCVVFLSLGLALPMIDLDARLSDVDLSLLGEQIHFDEQVLYFQSKSIFDVTITLLEGRGLDLKIVGFMILLFSIILPFLKLLLTTWYLFIEKVRKSKTVRTIIFYMGKWSMADVFVVAIFMAYIGFYGLVNSQLEGMATQSETMIIETVNYSKLSPGIIFFTLYCLCSIVMSMLVHYQERKGTFS